MGRSVVLAGSVRCPRCRLPPRWCVCACIPPVETPLGVHVFIHRHEHHKPSSTGCLVTRAVAGSACHIYQRATRFVPARGFPAAAVAHAAEVLILHPQGDPLPDRIAPPPPPGRRHVVLLDGTWRQAGEMLRCLDGLGRRVRLPDRATEPGRYWLREQPAATHRSTAEALIEVFRITGDPAAAERLRLHFELHVYATLLSRGRRELAERYLGLSPLRAEVPEVIDRLAAGPTSGPDVGAG